LLYVLFNTTFVNAAWYNPAWNSRIKITVNKSQVNGSVSDFPVYINLDDLPDSFFDNCNNNGSDLRVTLGDGSSELAREVVFVDKTANTGELWFKTPSLTSASNGNFYIYYGNSSATEPGAATTYGSQNVWSNGFVAVYHMNAVTNGTASVLDSSASAYHGTPYGGMSTIAVSKMGNSILFDGSNDYINFGTASLANLTNQMYVSTWIYPNAYGNYGGIITRQKNTPFDGGWGLVQNSFALDKLSSINFNSGSHEHALVLNNPLTSTWNYLSSRNLSGTRTLFLNSIAQETSTTIATASPSQMVAGRFYFDFNNHYFNGRIDEIRVVNKSRNNNWITTEYNNQNNASAFYTVNGEESNLNASNFLHKIKITINRSQVNGSVTGFPVYVNLDHMPAHFFNNVKSSGADIRITQSDLVTRVPVEIVSLNKATTNGELWFRASSLSSTSNSDFYLWYGNNGATIPTASSLYGSQNVWSNGFVAVYHMNTVVNGTVSVIDSTRFANHGTPRGGMTTGGNLILGKLSNAISFDGSNDFINLGTSSSLNTSPNINVSYWGRTTNIALLYQCILEYDGGAHYYIYYNILYNNPVSGGTSYNFAAGSSLSNNTWFYAVQNKTDGTQNIYSDGILRGNFGAGTNLDTSTNLRIGQRAGNSYSLNGSLDELRIANTARNNNWIRTEYNNQNSPNTFYSITPINNSNIFWGIAP
jgi:hypothetical protein